MVFLLVLCHLNPFQHSICLSPYLSLQLVRIIGGPFGAPPDLAVDVIAGTLFDSVARHCFVCSSILRIFYFFFILIPFPPSLRCSRWFKFFSESFGTLRLLTLPTGSPLTPGACSLGRHPPSSAAAQVPPLPCPCRRRATAPPSPVLRCGRRFPLLSLLRRGRHACAVP